MTTFQRSTIRPAGPARRAARRRFMAAAAFAAIGVVSLADGDAPRADEPEPRVVAPGAADQGQPPIPPPSDATVLFDGTSLDTFRSADGGAARWTIEGKHGGAMTITPGAGGIFSTHQFGDAQVHIEFATPAEVLGEGQSRGNSGVYLQGRYEVQVLDSFKNSTYPNGQCGAIYAQHAPLVNACRGPGLWQSYDIIFRAPRFDAAGTRIQPAQITVLHNGVLIHDHADVQGETTAAPIKEGPGDGPLYLQDHGCQVRYRNIWIRPLADQ
ncbi:MAG: DUF1080 domain-containing protein [Phycisphaerales bacterium]